MFTAIWSVPYIKNPYGNDFMTSVSLSTELMLTVKKTTHCSCREVSFDSHFFILE